MTDAEYKAELDVVTLVQRDHRRIEALLDQVAQATGAARREAFEDLVRKLAVHETAEEEVVHPVMRQIGADAVVEDILHEEDAAKRKLADLDGADVDSPEFAMAFDRLRESVLAHAQREEQDEHPRLVASESRDRLERMGRAFEVAERFAPTRPHPMGPESRSGNLVLGPVLAVSDRVRDAIRTL